MKNLQVVLLLAVLVTACVTFPQLFTKADTISAIKMTTSDTVVFDESLQEEVITLDKNSVVTVLSESNGWAKINYTFYTGYVPSNSLQIATVQYMLTSVKFEPNVRLINDPQGEVIGNLPSSSVVEVYSIDEAGWAFVRFGDLAGFVNKIALTTPTKKQMIVQEPTGLSVRYKASPSSKAIGTLPKSTEVTMLSTFNGWAFVTSKSLSGYVPVTGLKEAPKNTSTTNPKPSTKPNNNSSKKQIALTFDDGPNPKVTPQIVQTLKKYDAKATFFVVGKNVQKYPDIVKEVSKAGHEIGNHTYDHTKLTTLTVKQVSTQIQLTDIAVKAAIDQYTTVFRPPYGAYNKTITGLLEVPNIMWSIDTLDWKHHDPEKTLQIVKTNAKRDSIVLMHDIHQATADSLDSVLDYLSKQGYEFVTISELLAK
ncbi:xylanase [Solibacillus sp. R5-41]|uniref:polysaccharide deacetylase family protein n=1 Tax=Solibacillus sp. R5-41 TaxID=2048654 RepID=UPI000C127686|nr:polysaccharide deacetylase family protein [Solibacillus sp. R5-41]ATP41792.1 xylanase [Solibacillus sp. R5-41]